MPRGVSIKPCVTHGNKGTPCKGMNTIPKGLNRVPMQHRKSPHHVHAMLLTCCVSRVLTGVNRVLKGVKWVLTGVNRVVTGVNRVVHTYQHPGHTE
jgi:hypothetical protein